MVPLKFISIDQNSQPLWDTVPKIAALLQQGSSGIHYLEDIDTAFTRRGAVVGNAELEIVRERFYRGGVSDWGASLFYSDFLGRSALDVRELEPYTGMTTKALARALGLSMDQLYDRYAQSDNWQLVGTSYVGTTEQHRVVGDLTVAESASFVIQLLHLARRDMQERFPGTAARQRLDAWFEAEEGKLRQVMGRLTDGRLVDLYREWMKSFATGRVAYALTSDFFRDDTDGKARMPLLNLFLRDYQTVSTLYNEALQETAVGLNPLLQKDGELPFFAVWSKQGRMWRTGLQVVGDTLRAGTEVWKLCAGRGSESLPWTEMEKAGLTCIAGKAVLLVIQARLLAPDAALVLPYQGSLYMPAVHAFEKKLRQHALLDDDVPPVYRVRFNFLHALAGIDTVISLPEWLQNAFSARELTAGKFAEELPAVMRHHELRLQQLSTASGRQEFLGDHDGLRARTIAALEKRQKELARHAETRAEASVLWDQVKRLKQQQLQYLVESVMQSLHVANLSYWDSRGALLPWCIALGGERFYRQLLAQAEFYPDSGR